MSTLRVTNVQDTSGANSLTTAQIYSGAAKAWINFNGTGTVAFRASFNVQSITDNGTGDYKLTFTNAMTDANYATLTAIGDNVDPTTTAANDQQAFLGETLTNSIRLYLMSYADNDRDYHTVAVAIFR